MRICFVTNLGWPAGGAETSIMLLRSALVERGHEVLVVATDAGAAGRSDVFADILIPHIEGGPVRRLGQYLFFGAGYTALKRAFTSFRPDIVHFHTVGELSPAAIFAAWGTPFVMTVHGPEDFTLALHPWHLPATDYRRRSYRRSDLRPIGYLRLLYLRLMQRPVYRLALRRCKAFVAPSSFIARVLGSDVRSDRIVQLDNGVVLGEPTPVPGGERFVYVGRLEAVKGVDVLLRAVARARVQRPEIRLALVGDGDERASLEELSMRLGVSDSVTFRGRLDSAAVVSAISEAKALVIPSLWPETFGLVIVEAMAAGRPVLGSRVGAIPDIVTDGVNGVITDPYDEGALADVLVRLAGEDALCRKMGEAARERAEGYSVEKFTDNIWSLYNRIVRIAA